MKPLTLSDAIRKGAQYRPQTVGSPFHVEIKHDGTFVVKSCALGAAYEGVFGLVDVCLPILSPAHFMNSPISFVTCEIQEILDKEYPEIMAMMSKCPIEACNLDFLDSLSVGGMVYHLNDSHKWAREKIADWVATQEEKLGYVMLSEESSNEQEVIDANKDAVEVVGVYK